MNSSLQNVLVVMCMLMWTGTALAVPAAVPYIGFLSDDQGPFEGIVSITVEMFGQADGGASLWGPFEFPDVPVESGVFTVVLGVPSGPELDTLMLPMDSAWLEFTIDETLLIPRQEMLSVPYALWADHAVTCSQAEALNIEAAGEFIAKDQMSSYFTAGSQEYALGDYCMLPCFSGDFNDLDNKPDLSGYALTAELKLICFSGSYQDLVDLDLAGFVTLDELAAVATSGDYQDLVNKPGLSAFVVLSDLAIVATSGAYQDLFGKPDLSGFLNADGSVSLAGDLDIAKYRLVNVAVDDSPAAPPQPVSGQLWFDSAASALRVWTGAEWLALAAGDFDAAGTAEAMMTNHLEEYPNLTPNEYEQLTSGEETVIHSHAGLHSQINPNLIFSTFELEYELEPVPVPLNDPGVKAVTLDVPDLGVIKSVGMNISVAHADASQLEISLMAPDGTNVVLFDHLPGQDVELALDVASQLPEGSLADFVGNSAAGTWQLTVSDNKVGAAGSLEKWSLYLNLFSSERLKVQADVEVSGSLSAAEVHSPSLPVNWLKTLVDNAGLIGFDNAPPDEGERWILAAANGVRVGPAYFTSEASFSKVWADHPRSFIYSCGTESPLGLIRIGSGADVTGQYAYLPGDAELSRGMIPDTSDFQLIVGEMTDFSYIVPPGKLLLITGWSSVSAYNDASNVSIRETETGQNLLTVFSHSDTSGWGDSESTGSFRRPVPVPAGYRLVVSAHVTVYYVEVTLSE